MSRLAEAAYLRDCHSVLESYRVEIDELETRARAVRETWFSTDYEANQIHADELDMAARNLRSSLQQMMHSEFAAAEERSASARITAGFTPSY
jgi:hypothetical protein